MIIMTLLLSAFIISGISLGTAWSQVTSSVISDKDVNNLKSETEKEKEEISVKDIDKSGYVQVENAKLYNDVEMSNSEKELYLFEKVHVIEQLGEDVYKIKGQGLEGYILDTDVNLNQELIKTDLPLDTLQPYLSEEFNDAYLYYLSFLGETIEHLEEKIPGIERGELENGSIDYQSYYTDVVFKSFDGEIIQQIELDSTLSMSDDLYDYIKEHSISNESDTQYYMETENYNYFIDFLDGLIRIE